LRKKRRVSTWTTKTDSNAGPCAAFMNNVMPVFIPLWCSGVATDLQFSATASGHTSPRLRLSIDSIDKGYRTFPVYPATRVWSVTHASLSAGLHIVKYSGDRLVLEEVVLTGRGGSCSFDSIGSYDPGSFTNTGLDVIHRVLGPNTNFSEPAKRGLYFASEVLGTSDDNSISATAMGNGLWEWLYQYNLDQKPDDPWLSKIAAGQMYDESRITPYLEVSLDQFPGRNGDDMIVAEPCNTVSNIMYHEAAVWVSCKGYHFDREDMSTLMGSFNALAAGSSFMHASATRTGQLGDTVPMKLLMLQVHQIMTKSLVSRATGLTQQEKDTIVYNRRTGLATDHARTLTALFRGPYSTSKWEKEVQGLDLPDYELSIATVVVTVVEALDGNYPIPGTSWAVNALIDVLLDAIGGPDFEWIEVSFRPAIRKALKSVPLCRSAGGDLFNSMLDFCFTFVEAFLFQEELVPIPDIFRDILLFFESIGSTIGSYSDLRETWELYNGEKRMCESRSPHMSWHEKAAHGLVHIAKVAEIMLTNTGPGC